MSLNVAQLSQLTTLLAAKKGGFVSLRHNQVRNLTASQLNEVCHHVCVEPQLLQLTGENLKPK